MLASRPTVMTLETITSAAFMTACSCHIDTIVENSAGVGKNSFVLLDVEHIVDAGKGGRSETSGLNSCSPVHTTTNVSRRRRRAFGFPPRQRFSAARQASGQLRSALHRAASAARSRHLGTRARHD